MQIEREHSNQPNRLVRARRTTAVGACLAFVVTAAIATVMFLPSSAGAAQSKAQPAAASCNPTYTAQTSPSGTAGCTTVTTCAGATTTSIPAATTTTQVPRRRTTNAPTTTTTTVEATTSTAPGVGTTLPPPTTIVATTPTVGNVPPPTVATTTSPASGPVGSGLLPATTTTLPAPSVEGITAKLPGPAVSRAESLPKTGLDWVLPGMFGTSCLVAGVVLVLRRRGAWSA